MMRQAKVLICIRRLDRGGAEQLECRLAVELNKLNVEAHLLGQYSADLFEGEKYSAIWQAKGVKKVYWLASQKKHNYLRSLLFLKNLIKTERYDVVITHNSGLDIFVGLCKYIVNFRHIIAFHDYFIKSKIPRLKFWVWKKIIKNADDFYCITKVVQQNINYLFAPGKPGKVVYNSIGFNEQSIERSLAEELGIDKEKKIIFSAGRILPNKGFDINLNVLAKLKYDNYVYVIAGGEELDPAHYAAIVQLVDQLGLKDKVHFIGHRENIFKYLQQSVFLLHLARHEGFGLVLLEAVAAGIPVVASNVGGIPEVLDKTPYQLFDINDEDGILKQINTYLAMDIQEYKRITEKAKTVLPYYSDERRARDIIAIIEANSQQSSHSD